MSQLIDKLPASIQDAYEILLQRCRDPYFARKVFQIVLVAGRPLTLDEMDVALKVSEHTSSYADLELEGPSRMEDILLTRCSLIISIVQSKVYFIHQTVKDFLLQIIGFEPPAGSTWQQSLRLEESHDIMAEICLRSITFSEIRLDRVNLCNALLPEDIRDIGDNRGMKSDRYWQRYAFLSYAAVYLADHYRNTRNSKYLGIITRFLEISSHRSVFGETASNYGTTLHAASAGGHESIVKKKPELTPKAYSCITHCI